MRKLFSLLYSLLPASIRKRIYSAVEMQVKQNLEEKRKKKEGALPQIELQTENIQNLRILTNKIALLDVLPKHGIVAEIGVAEGNYSE
jgi:hypothetical protein